MTELESATRQFGPDQVLEGYDKHLEFLRTQVYESPGVPLIQREILNGQMTRIIASRDEFLFQSELAAAQIAEKPREYLGTVVIEHDVLRWPEDTEPVLPMTPPFARPLGGIATESAIAA